MSLEHSPARQTKDVKSAAHETGPPVTHDTAPPSADGERLLKKAEVCSRVGVTAPTLWAWQLAGKFPRAHDANGIPVWFESEVLAWMKNLPIKSYKGDPDAAQVNAVRIRAVEASVESRRRAKAAERKKNVRARRGAR